MLCYWKSAFFSELSDAAIAVLADAFERAPSDNCALVIERFGGEAARVVEEAVGLARIRWQIELIFKLWKGRGGIDRWRSSKPRSSGSAVPSRMRRRELRAAARSNAFAAEAGGR